jgi:opacity protein-like surface antigen
MRFCLALLVVLSTAASAAAQDVPRPPRRPAPDFLFNQPRGSITVRGSWLFARSSSDWYEFVTDQLTLDRKDFNVPGIGFDVNGPITPRLEVGFSFDFNRSNRLSEYRDWLDNNRLPIEQTTTLQEMNLSGNVRYSLVERGRQVGNFVWVPRAIVPFVGAGVGAFHYRLEQIGDFVDFKDLAVFSSVFSSRGWTPSAQVFGGVDVRVLKHVAVTVDGRYLWAAAELQRDWVDFKPIDLAGFRLSGGVNFIF